MQWFKHDTTASTDDLIMALRIEHGGAAVDCYWAILEQIYREETDLVIGRNQPATKALCHRLATTVEYFEKWVSAMVEYGLLECTGTDGDTYTVGSLRAGEFIGDYQRKCETARQNGAKGGRKPKKNQGETDSVPNGNQVAKQQPSVREDIKNKNKNRKEINKEKKPTGTEAVADRAAPLPVAEKRETCPNCEAFMEKTNVFKPATNERVYKCPLCGTEVYRRAS